MKLCERCQAPPPAAGEDGTLGMHEYCAHCSADLCADCMSSGNCLDSPSGKHEPERDEDGEEL